MNTNNFGTNYDESYEYSTHHNKLVRVMNVLENLRYFDRISVRDAKRINMCIMEMFDISFAVDSEINFLVSEAKDLRNEINELLKIIGGK